MPDYYVAVTAECLPASLQATDGEFAIRQLSEAERFALEDLLERNDAPLKLDPKGTAVVVPYSHLQRTRLEDFATLVEFGLGILVVAGFQPVAAVAAFTSTGCTEALNRAGRISTSVPRFSRTVLRSKAAAVTWMRYLFAARQKNRDRLHITADRFVRYLQSTTSSDGLVDLCICLESLIEAENEISFRFCMCLARVTGRSDAEEISDILRDLYSLRSKVVHGSDPSKELKKVGASADALRRAARAILTVYISYLVDNSRDEWKKHLKRSLLA